MKIIIVVVIIAIIGISAAAYAYYTEMQHKNEELNKSLNAMKTELEEVKAQNNTTVDDTSSSSASSPKKSQSSTKKVSSSSGKVTYEEAGVDKNIGYMKTCKYDGCGAVYDSRLSHCPRCGQRNIYV